MRGDAGDAGLPVKVRAQRGGQAEIVELRRPQAEREQERESKPVAKIPGSR